MLRFIPILFLLNTVHAQSNWDVGASFGGNGTIMRTIKTDNNTWGYSTPAYPRTWSNHFYVGFGNQTDRAYFVFDGGSLGTHYRLKTHPLKHPFTDAPSSEEINPNSTALGSISQSGVSLIKLSLQYKHNWTPNKRFSHKSIVGAGFLQTWQQNSKPLSGSGTAIEYWDSTTSSMALVAGHYFTVDHYGFLRNKNMYLIAGYELSFNIGERWNLNASIIYNQGIFKMIRWHSYREYIEPQNNYSEFDEQWSYTRLSYYSLLMGVSYDIPNRKKKKSSS